MSTLPKDQNQALRTAFIQAMKMRTSGVPLHEIEDALVENGLRRDRAKLVLNQVMEQHVSAARQQDSRSNKMVVGAVVCMIGILVTLGTYSAASSSGGTYIVAWGAILWGAIQFFRGLMESNG